MKSCRNLQLIVVILVSLGCCFGISRGAENRDGLKSLNLSHGLSDLLINKIFRDSAGFVWFGTETSLDRFDGNQIHRYKFNVDNRRSKRVLDIAQGMNGRLYVGTNQGLFRLNSAHEELVQIDPSIIDSPVRAVVAHEGNIYAATSKGLFIYNEDTGEIRRKLIVDDNLSDENNITGLYTQNNEILWILTQHKLWRLNLQQNALHSYTLPTRAATKALAGIGDTIYVATDGNGVLTFNTATNKFGEPIVPGNGIITSLSIANNLLLIGTDGDGVFEYSVPQHQLLHNYTSGTDSEMRLRSNAVYSALRDSDSILWVGYYQSGVDYMPARQTIVEELRWPSLPQLPNTLVRAFKKHNNQLLIGTHNGVIYIDLHNNTSQKFEKPIIDSNIIFDVEYWNGKFYIGTYHGGLYEFDPAAGQPVAFGGNDLRDISIFRLVVDNEGMLWAATSDGIFQFDRNNIASPLHITSQNSQLPPGNVYEIFFDSNSRGWICTENGIAVKSGDQILNNIFPTGFDNNMKVRTIFEDSHHNLYFAPDRGELWKSDLSLKNFGPISVGVEGRFSQITAILEDNNGDLWFGTDKGLLRYNPIGSFNLFNNVNGVHNPVYTLAKPYLSPEGNLWFGSTSGLHIVSQNQLKNLDHSREDRLLITDISSHNTYITNRLRESERNPAILRIDLEDNENELVINVSDLNFNERDFFEIEYYMEGIDKEWKEGNGTNPITYADIPAGKYRLHIRKPGNTSSEITLNIFKSTPWSILWLIPIIFIIIISLAIWMLYKQKQRHKKEIEELTREHTRQLQQLSLDPTEDKSKEVENIPYKNMRLSDEECRRILKKIDTLMKDKSPYRNPNLKLRDLAQMSDTTTHSLSFIFNQYLKKSFYDYINEYRVKEFKRMVKEGDISKYTLSTLAEKCGFSSRASFFRHFKNITGETPAEYIKSKE